MARIAKQAREDVLNSTRQRLLDAAVGEFAQKGFPEANINQISLTAGFSKGTIYNYFPSKQALMLALIADAGALHGRYIEERLNEAGDPQKCLLSFFTAGFSFVEEHPLHARFLITTLYSPGFDFREAMAQAYQPMFRLVAEKILAPGIAQGLFRNVGLNSTASLLMTVYLGTSSQVDQNGKAFMDPRQVGEFILRGLLADRSG